MRRVKCGSEMLAKNEILGKGSLEKFAVPRINEMDWQRNLEKLTYMRD